MLRHCRRVAGCLDIVFCGGQEGDVEYGQKSGGWEVWPDAHACTALSRYQT